MDVEHEDDSCTATPALAADECPERPTRAQLLTELHAMGA